MSRLLGFITDLEGNLIKCSRENYFWLFKLTLNCICFRLERSKVRVSFFQQSRPQQISPLNSTENLLHLDYSLPIMAATTVQQTPPGPLSATATITDINGQLQQYSRQERY